MQGWGAGVGGSLDDGFCGHDHFLWGNVVPGARLRAVGTVSNGELVLLPLGLWV